MTAMAQDRKSYDIYRASSPITIDAKLDDAAWRNAPSVGPFNFHANPGDPANQQTSVKLLWDDENLYLGYEMDDKRISAYVTERHGPVRIGCSALRASAFLSAMAYGMNVDSRSPPPA